MSKFKVGDRVIGNKEASEWYSITVEGWIGTVESVREDDFQAGGYTLRYKHFDLVERPLTLRTGSAELLDNETFTVGNFTTKKTNIMTNLITTFKNITRSEPNKTFVKAGVMHEDLSLTSEGQQLFIQYLFDKHATEFKKDVVDAILAEQEKK